MESRLVKLSARELEVLFRIINGLRNSQIAEELSISPKTLETHIRNIYAKLEIESRSELLLDSEKWRLLFSQFKPHTSS
jgi:DNA-binding CsgD family transcriptional regulator